jgi:MOSC domain-containing protein YiiM
VAVPHGGDGVAIAMAHSEQGDSDRLRRAAIHLVTLAGLVADVIDLGVAEVGPAPARVLYRSAGASTLRAYGARRAAMRGTVEGIFIAGQAGQPMRSVPEVVGEAGRGLVGDRHYRAGGAASPPGPGEDVHDVSLIEAEVLESLRDEYGIELAGDETRRNVLTRGVRVNDLIGRRFRLGDLLCEGFEICEPCVHMQSKVGKPVLKPLVHRGGLRARILESGTVRIGDPIVAVEAATIA